MIVIVVAAVVSVRALNGPGDGKKVILQSGTFHGLPWTLWAQETDGQLCMGVDGARGTSTSYTGACGFDRSRPDSDYYANGLGPAGSLVTFGPLPSRATNIRVPTGRVLVASRMPGGHRLPKGRYWIYFSPDKGVVAKNGEPADPQPLDEHGRRVPFVKF